MKKLAAMGLALLCSMVGVAAWAQTLQGFSVHPLRAKAGDDVTITARFDISAGLNCNVRVHFGDGQTKDVKINQEKDANFVLSHSYKQPGAYTVKIEPKTALPTLKCLGENQQAVVTVLAPPPVAAAATMPSAPPAVASGPHCPSGWTLMTKSVNKKSGAYECSARPGRAAPAEKLACPGQLGYYENTKTGRLGCRP